VVPVVNENDVITTDEIRIGDNDTMAALAANLVDAHGVILLTDQDGVYEKDPRMNPQAALITSCRVDDARVLAAAGDGGKLGRGGMRTKIKAARLAARVVTGARTTATVAAGVGAGEDQG